MNKISTFEQFLTGSTPPIDMLSFVINLSLTFILALLISSVYIKYGKSMSNRKAFARNLIMIAMTTMTIITIVKSSLALSLGLVGALSIVRFRTPIKEPEELSYLFLSIAVGLGFGAGQRGVTFVGCLFILIIVAIRQHLKENDYQKGMLLSISTLNARGDLLQEIITILEKNSIEATLRRFDEMGEKHNSDFFVSFGSTSDFNRTRNELRAIDKGIQISFIDNNIL